MGAVKDHQANTSLTTLDLGSNKVGDAGATALAEALQATVLASGQQLFRAWFTGCCSVALRSGVSGWRVAAFVFILVSWGENVACRGVLPASCSQVDVARCATTARLQDPGRALGIPTVMLFDRA